MNKAELIEALAARTELTKAKAGEALDAVLDIVSTEIAKGQQVALIGFGTFKSALRAAREGRNPATGETLKIAAAKLPKFTAGATLKALVSGKKPAAKKAAAKPAAKKAAAKPAAKPAAKKPTTKKK
ncbi:MAG: HU family DNA-binding protein [Rhodocyclaceae bacterium]|nr:HU family DNA-binding protein [Rhodocyclaceae bacterium]MBK6907181.1 HU family DNA-binding protein [Rhodocyclaceae bacterium]